jgi:hypothetical protein
MVRRVGNITFSTECGYENTANHFTVCNCSGQVVLRSFVSLKIYDVLGKDVVAVVNEELPAGSYSRTWNASGIPSGVYFYRLQAGPITETKRLILLR